MPSSGSKSKKPSSPPVAIYDPVDSPFNPRYALYRYPYFWPHYGEHRAIGGGTVYTLKALAIKYATDVKEEQ